MDIKKTKIDINSALILKWAQQNSAINNRSCFKIQTKCHFFSFQLVLIFIRWQHGYSILFKYHMCKFILVKSKSMLYNFTSNRITETYSETLQGLQMPMSCGCRHVGDFLFSSLFAIPHSTKCNAETTQVVGVTFFIHAPPINSMTAASSLSQVSAASARFGVVGRN